jgi:hypothetical protein
MKKIALISTFCDTQEKINILRENILILKELGLDVLLVSPLLLTDEIIKISDFVFFTKENPILRWPDRAFTFWKTIYFDNKLVTMHNTISDYGWAALYQIKKMSEIAMTFDYDIFYHFIYDLEIDEVVKNEIINNEINLLHPRVNPNNPNDIWDTTLHFMVFDRETMQKVVDKIILKDYLSVDGVAEGQALRWAKEIPLEIKSHPVKDKIYYYEGVDLFDYTLNRGYKTFFNKSTEPTDKNFKVAVYNIEVPQNLKIYVNDEIREIEMKTNTVVTFDTSSLEIKKFILEDRQGFLDLTDTWNSVSRNLIYDEIS